MEKKNLALIGFMGTFKTSAGKIVAQKLGLEFVDADEQIEKELKMSIAEVFASHGEQFFRDAESQVIESLSQREAVLISCGGGVVLRDANMQSLKKSAVVVLLSASAEAVYERIKNDLTRPVFRQNPTVEGIRQSMEKRNPLYIKYADYTVDTTHLTSVEVAKKILEVFLAT